MTEADDKKAYEEWKQCREREMQTEQQAAAGVTLRWTTTEQRRGRVKLFLPPEAVRATPAGPRLKHQTEIYGRMVYDWGAVLGKPTPEMIAETTRDLEDEKAHRCQVVCFTGEAARQAAEHETIVALQGTAEQTKQLQTILGGLDLRDLHKQEVKTLEKKIKEWAQYHGRPYGKRWTARDDEQGKQIEKMTRMLKGLGLTHEEITRRLHEESQTQREPGETDHNGDVQMVSGSEQPTDKDDDSGTRPWAPPYMDGGGGEGGGRQIGGDDDPYLRMGQEPSHDESNDSEPIGPMTSSELQKRGRKVGDGRGTERSGSTWKKGLPKAMDVPGAWDVFNAETQPERTGRSTRAPPTQHQGAQEAGGRRTEEPTRRMTATETKKTEAKTRSNKSTPNGEKTQPPRGGRKP